MIFCKFYSNFWSITLISVLTASSEWTEINGFFFWIIWYFFSVIQPCTIPNSNEVGECISLKKCAKFNGVLITPDLFTEIQNRGIGCIDKKTICCETTLKNRNEQTTILSTLAPTSTTKLTTKFPFQAPQEIVNLRNHKNYNLVEEKKCGKSEMNRVANGEH
jgi:hypothetical protein